MRDQKEGSVFGQFDREYLAELSLTSARREVTNRCNRSVTKNVSHGAPLRESVISKICCIL